jgi:hypothetical protein
LGEMTDMMTRIWQTGWTGALVLWLAVAAPAQTAEVATPLRAVA